MYATRSKFRLVGGIWQGALGREIGSGLQRLVGQKRWHTKGDLDTAHRPTFTPNMLLFPSFLTIALAVTACHALTVPPQGLTKAESTSNAVVFAAYRGAHVPTSPVAAMEVPRADASTASDRSLTPSSGGD